MLEIEVVNGALVPNEEMARELQKLKEFQVTMQEMKNEETAIKQALDQAFEKAGIEKHTVEFAGAKFVYNKPSTRTSVDSKKLKEEMPDIYEAYKKVSNVNGSWTADYGN